MKVRVSAIVVVALCAVMVAQAAPLRARRAQSVDVSEASAKAIQGKPAAATSVMVANGTLRPRPGHSLFVDMSGKVGIVVPNDKNQEPGRYAAETVLIRDWDMPDGRYLVWMSCSCRGQSEDNCAFARDGSGNMNLNQCLGQECCEITTILLNDTTGDWETF